MVPLTWPIGHYGLPATKYGCPEETGFKWEPGLRVHTADQYFSPSNSWSSDIHWGNGLSRENIIQKFCMKTKDVASEFDFEWPKGTYCIFKSNRCPNSKFFSKNYSRENLTVISDSRALHFADLAK